jgi:hypothetical protein
MDAYNREMGRWWRHYLWSAHAHHVSDDVISNDTNVTDTDNREKGHDDAITHDLLRMLTQPHFTEPNIFTPDIQLYAFSN